MKFQGLLVLILFTGINSFSQHIPVGSCGSIERTENFQSRFVDSRNIDVWLPEGYNRKNKYAVIYMHDGQMLFDSTATWNKQSWDVQDVATQLMRNKKVQDFIVVGIWNVGKSRHAEYFPQKPFESLTQEQKNKIIKQLQEAGKTTDIFKPLSDNYLKFLVTELKPYIDKKYSVYTDRKHTFISGSSMGGLISIYAICKYPRIFGGAACLSTHWPGTFTVESNPIPEAFCNYLKKHLPKPGTHRIYFDYGDQTLDSLYPDLQKSVDRIMELKGFTDKNWITRFYPGDDHSERSWHRRLHIPLEFLLKN